MFLKFRVYKTVLINCSKNALYLSRYLPLIYNSGSNQHFKLYNSRLFNSNCFKMKIDTPEFHKILTEDLKTLLNIFHKYNYEIRIAGGAVRDLLLGKTPSDVDFATNATPDQMKDMFTKENIRMINAKGEKHGTITARINNDNFEVTTLRIDVVTDGRHAEVEFTKDWELDANRRDFTVNSMFLGPDGTLYDYCNGYDDLKKRKIVFVGDPKKRIMEDYLRILRYFRFYGKISEKEDEHDTDTLKVISDNVDGLGNISGERIWVEVKKILLGNYSCSLMKRLMDSGAGKYIGINENPDFRSMKILLDRIKGLQVSHITVLSSLFDNIEQFGHFHSRCKLSNQEKNLGIFIIENRLSEEPLKHFKCLLLTPRLPPVTRDQIMELFKYKGDIEKLDEFQNWEAPKMPINGNDLLVLGVPTGKPLGNVMNKLKMHWIDNDFLPDKEELLGLVPSVVKELKIKLIAK